MNNFHWWYLFYYTYMSHLAERKRPITDYLNRETSSTTELSYLSSITIAFYTKGTPLLIKL